MSYACTAISCYATCCKGLSVMLITGYVASPAASWSFTQAMYNPCPESFYGMQPHLFTSVSRVMSAPFTCWLTRSTCAPCEASAKYVDKTRTTRIIINRPEPCCVCYCHAGMTLWHHPACQATTLQCTIAQCSTRKCYNCSSDMTYSWRSVTAVRALQLPPSQNSVILVC